MAKDRREGISAKLRFEVFKRDKFTCQYCGATAAQKLLHCDHVVPVAGGGETTLLNLTTACVDCNLGKGRRPLSDDSAMSIQHKQLADLEERRQQLDMMRQWREELEKHAVTEVDIVADEIEAKTPFSPNEVGRKRLRRLIKKYGLVETLAATDEAFDLYFKDGSVEQWEGALQKIDRMASIRAQEKTDPHIRKLLYVNGILRKRFDTPYDNYVERLRDCLNKGYPVDVIESAAKRAADWPQFITLLNDWNAGRQKAPPAEETEEEREFTEEDALLEEYFAAWRDPEWAIGIFASCLQNEIAREWLPRLADGCGSGGYCEGGKLDRSTIHVLRGFHAVGLIEPIRNSAEIFRTNEEGICEASFRILCPTPRETTAAFNRFGGIKLGFWVNPRGFARVDQIY